jgi:hypothetical protein
MLFSQLNVISLCRVIALIVCEQEKPSDKELLKLKLYLDRNSWMNAQDILTELEITRWNDLQVYSHTLEQY